MTNTIEDSIREYATDQLNDGIGVDTLGCELHHDLFNTDYFIIGYHEAEQWLEKNPGSFHAIGIVRDYENDNFGEVSTDLSDSEKVVNMYAYIQGEELLSESNTLKENWDNNLTPEMIKTIIEELEA